ncbi:ABC transporter permease subunit [Treponema sp. HNW]|uniref:ABC transporter permease subunit n=1 Tax=Treponema sp. HNW TaxID=3116654 RepID=UPI003D13C166
MRFLRFLLKEFIIHGIVFAVAGTLLLSASYLLSIGAPIESYGEAAKSFFLLITGSEDFSAAHPGFSSGQIIASAAAVSLPLTMLSLVILTLIALSGSAYAVTGRYVAEHHKNRSTERFGSVVSLLSSVLAAVPLFVGFWVLANAFGSDAPFIIIAFITVVLGGLSWDATNFLKADMLSQVGSTHAVVFSTLGHSLGRFFPLPETYSGYLFSSSLPRFIPYLAGKVPAIIGAVTIAEIVFSFPGLGSTLLDALLATNTDLLVASVFILLCVNAVVAFFVKTILFLIYPRWYEKAI